MWVKLMRIGAVSRLSCKTHVARPKRGAQGIAQGVSEATAWPASKLVRKPDPGVVVRAYGRAELMRGGHRKFNPAIDKARSDKLEAGTWREVFPERRCVIPMTPLLRVGPGVDGRKQVNQFLGVDAALKVHRSGHTPPPLVPTVSMAVVWELASPVVYEPLRSVAAKSQRFVVLQRVAAQLLQEESGAALPTMCVQLLHPCQVEDPGASRLAAKDQPVDTGQTPAGCAPRVARRAVRDMPT